MIGHVIFRETQRWRDVWWVIALVFGLATIQWGIFFIQIIRGIPVGNNPGSDILVIIVWLIFGIVFPLYFLWLRMVVEVDPDAITIVYRPFVNRRIPLTDIVHFERRVYRPLGEFGGWGIRGLGAHVAYSVRGNNGVELTLVDGRHVMLGSQRTTELAEAIHMVWRGPN